MKLLIITILLTISSLAQASGFTYIAPLTRCDDLKIDDKFNITDKTILITPHVITLTCDFSEDDKTAVCGTKGIGMVTRTYKFHRV